MRHALLRSAFRPLVGLAFVIAFPRIAWADDAGDAASFEGGEGDASDASTDAATEATDTDAADDGADSSVLPVDGIPECPIENLGMPCDRGTCIPATCADWGSSTMRACAVCSVIGEPLCRKGLPCEDGGVCQVMGGGAGSGVGLDGGPEFVAYDNLVCAPPPLPSAAAPVFEGTSGGYPTSRYPAGCCEVAPLGTAPARGVALASALAIAFAGVHRRRRNNAHFARKVPRP